MHKKGLLLTGAMVFMFIMLTGCFQGEQTLDELDAPPENAEAVDNADSIIEDDESELSEDMDEENNQDIVQETVARQLYLVDANGMLVAQTLELPAPESKEVATQVLEYLVKEGPVTPILPNGFQAVLPEGTEILGLNLQEDGTLIVDVSEDFKNYEAKEELTLLEAMTYTLTQFENINKIKLWINGDPQEEMPVNGTPIGGGYSRTNGINIIKSDTIDLINSQAVTMYYPAEFNKNRYFIPVTRHVERVNDELFSSMVEALIDGPGYDINALHVFNTETSLLNPPKLKDGVLELTFSKDILQDIDKSIISDEVMETLVRTFTEQIAVESIEVKVENVNNLLNENGEPYNEPVTTNTFIPVSKM